MERPSKKDIKAAVEGLKSQKAGSDLPAYVTPGLSPKKPNKNRIRKQGV